MFKTRFYGWQEATLEEYSKCHDRFGGGVLNHPKYLEFAHAYSECAPKYFVKYKKNSELIAGICTWSGKDNKRALAWDHHVKVERPSIGFNCDEIILPISDKEKVFLPYRTKILSDLNCGSIANTTYKINSGRAICLAKKNFSSKAKGNREREVRKFFDVGGEVRKASEFSSDDIAYIYDKLFRIRRGSPSNFPMLAEGIKHLPDFYFGNVLLLNGEPCAYQLISMAESPKWINFDFVNIVIDTSLAKLSVGSVVMWLNIKDAMAMCASKNKEMRFSFGNDTGEYKSLWCYKKPLGRVFI